MNVFLINAHQPTKGISEGRLNTTMSRTIKEEMERRGFEVRYTEINLGYNIDEEVTKHLWADLIITQSPVNWFGNPWIYKKYIDEVFTAGLIQQSMLTGDGRSSKDSAKQYGTGGKMQGKKYMLSLTWNAPEEAFNNNDQFLFRGKSVDDVFVFNTANYKFCGVEILPSFSCHNVIKQANIDNDIKRLKAHLAAII